MGLYLRVVEYALLILELHRIAKPPDSVQNLLHLVLLRRRQVLRIRSRIGHVTLLVKPLQNLETARHRHLELLSEKALELRQRPELAGVQAILLPLHVDHVRSGGVVFSALSARLRHFVRVESELRDKLDRLAVRLLF